VSNNICVVGAGYWGKNHIRTLHEQGLLGGIVESDSTVLKRFSDQYPEVDTYENIDYALQNKNFGGFTVATPAETHYGIAKEIIQSGKHVLVEKPLTLNIEDATELVDLARMHNVNVMVGHVLLFHPAIQKIKKLIDDGRIGKLQYIYSNRLNLGQVRTEENVFWSLAPHDIAIFQYIIDFYPDSIKANGVSFIQNKIHDSTITQLKYPHCIEAHIFVSWLHPFKEHRMVIIGTEAMISFEDSSKHKPLKLYSKKIMMDKGIPEKINGPVEEIEYEQKMPLTEELLYFNHHLDGSPIEIANARHALEVTKILVEASNQLEA
jgi:UDP-2-acetamido-3-amino-2,3-dideoxy-glucuronate N-acetyltransferase